MAEQGNETSNLAEKLEADLIKQYGPMLSGESLRSALGYPSMDALRQAYSRGRVPVPIFPIENRRGKYALAKDVARWLAELRTKAPIRNGRKAM
jgi:hypothetical protein